MQQLPPAICKLLHEIVTSLLPKGSNVNVTSSATLNHLAIFIAVDEANLPMVAGPGGRTARSLQAIAHAAAARAGDSATVEVVAVQSAASIGL